MKIILTLLLILPFALLVSCNSPIEKEEYSSDWHPQDASVARHITTVHGFTISEAEDSHLKVDREEDGSVTAKFRDDVLAELGGERAMMILGWDNNPMTTPRDEYLYFLEALHAYLVLNAPKWDGGEGPG